MDDTVAVVGAGPAGCAAAWRLGRQGITTVLFESGTRGKDKPCGDALVQSAVKELAEMGLTSAALKRIRGRPVPHLSLRPAGASAVVIDMGSEPNWTVPRKRLDQRLRDQAARTARVRYRCAVERVLPLLKGGGAELVFRSGKRERFDVVILASGASGALARSLGLDGAPTTAVAISGYLDAPDSEDLEFVFNSIHKGGYAWNFPMVGGRANAGVFMVAPRHRRAAALFRRLFQERSRVVSARGGRETLWSGRPLRRHHPAGVLSCGDAAGLVNPCTGEGISAALESGRRAADAVARYLAGRRDVAALQEYSRWVYEHFSALYGRRALAQWRRLSACRP